MLLRATSMSSSRSIFVGLGVLAAALAAPNARAQSSVPITMTKAFPDRSANAPLNAHNIEPTAISFDDCEKDIQLTFDFTLGGSFNTSGASLQIWATNSGTDCTQLTSRTSSPGSTLCTKIAPDRGPLSQALSVQLAGRDIVWVGQAPSTTIQTSYVAHTDESSCRLQTNSAGPTVNVYFLIVDTQSAVIGTMQTASYPIHTDTVGPLPLARGGQIGIGSQLLKVPWTLPSPPDSDFAGVRVFATPPPGMEGQDAAQVPQVFGSVCASAADSGVSTTDSGLAPVSVAPFDLDGGDGGDAADADADAADSAAALDSSTALDSGGGVDSGCTSSVGGSPDFHDCTHPSGSFQDGILGGVIPDVYRVADLGLGSSEADIKGLTNNVEYTFAVAPLDKLGNVGPITVIGCDYAQDINDFWGNYKGEGGGAGGSSFCALESPGAPAAASVFAVTIGGVLLALNRRRRKK
jgi:hypothetical protein